MRYGIREVANIPGIYGDIVKFKLFYVIVFKYADAIVFVVSNSDIDRIEEARLELRKLLNTEILMDLPFLILINKFPKSREKPKNVNIITNSVIIEKFRLNHLDKERVDIISVDVDGIDWGKELINWLCFSKK